MTARVLGISGSPVANSNTDRAVRLVLEHTGLDAEFIKLSEFRLEPCRACLGCVETNRCVLDDDGPGLAERFLEADAFVLGGYTSYGSLDARTKAFMERTFCLRHQRGLNQGKPGALVVTSACRPDAPGMPPVADTVASQVAFWMMAEGIRDLGTLVLCGNMPCIRCGHGDDCPLSGVKMLEGSDATVASVGIRRLEDAGHLVARAAELGHRIRRALVPARHAQPTGR